MSAKSQLFLKITAASFFAAMVTVNALANILPINGITTGKVSSLYESLITPSAPTFAIWVLIYLWLALYVVYSFLPFGKRRPADSVFEKITPYFILSCLADIFWIFAWHNLEIPFSVLFIAVILYCLICIMNVINGSGLSPRGEFFVKMPFGLYLGWITAAAIANAAALLVSVDWDRFGLSQSFWAVAALIAGVLVSAPAAHKYCCPLHTLAVIWAYAGILIKHLSPAGFDREYPAVIVTVSVCIAALAALALFILFKRDNNRPEPCL